MSSEENVLALEQVRVIVDNTEESIAAWIVKHADAWQKHMDDNPTTGWSGEQLRPLFYKQIAQLIRQGEWRA